MRILCFHLNQVGDMAFSLPVLKCIRDTYPDSHITSVIRPSMAEILRGAGLVDEVLSRSSGLNREKLALARSLSSGRYDLAVVISQSAECALLAWLSRAPKRIGFADTSLGSLLTSRIEFHHPPSTQNNLRLVEAIGCKITCRNYSGLLKPTPAQIDRANAIFEAHGVSIDQPIAAFAPSTSGRRSVKEWTDEGFAAAGRHLVERGIKPVVLGTEPATKIIEGCDAVLDLSGKTNLVEAMAVLHRSKLLIAVDSGILHLGAAVGTRVIGLYGPSNPSITGPQGEGHVVLTSGAECSPCIKTECSLGRQCMIELSADQVITAVDSLLGSQENGS